MLWVILSFVHFHRVLIEQAFIQLDCTRLSWVKPKPLRGPVKGLEVLAELQFLILVLKVGRLIGHHWGTTRSTLGNAFPSLEVVGSLVQENRLPIFADMGNWLTSFTKIWLGVTGDCFSNPSKSWFNSDSGDKIISFREFSSCRAWVRNWGT